MGLKLVKYDKAPESGYLEYINEWEVSGEVIVPMASSRKDANFQELLTRWATDETNEVYKKGFVPSTLYFLVHKKKVLGAIHFRHELNDDLLCRGGHIGYGIRSSERGNGYATKMLTMLLDLVREKGYKKILITCDERNIASAKTIENASGIFCDKTEIEGEITLRYWINLDS
ncbi:GNAT family N-acetyltransferase [uncultured Ilyobacter sp.]|uniref:GNAT family N-acetyltransferase n=1 Tax=uncultured Ilyobacter sp. TaxID=544433 RepID=UPI0029C68C32|nr:GNAT family N-acetyltransferase [uncultured Ilyobacter sp.]